MAKITVVDSIMGSGKTTAAINMINDNPDKNYIFVTPYVKEAERIWHLTGHRTRLPFYHSGTKLDDLHTLLARGESIATTHALLLRATPETEQLIHEGAYTLILDETLSPLQEYNDVVNDLGSKNLSPGDVSWLKNESIISVDDVGKVSWLRSKNRGFHYSEVESLASSGHLRCVDDVLFWEYSASIFSAFEEVYLLTYLFEGSQFDCYLLANGLGEYEMLSAGRDESGKSVFLPYDDDSEQRRAIAELIDIYEGELNFLGRNATSFSVNWLDKREGDEIAELRQHMRRYRALTKARSCDIMWTTVKNTPGRKDFYKQLEKQSGFKYTRNLTKEEKDLPEEDLRKYQCFVPCNARATNDFSDRTVLLYLLNRFPNPQVQKYYANTGYPLDEDQFATSELLQWIWRSAIRKGEPIRLYLPSKRMRLLLYRWLGVTPPNDPRSKRWLKPSIDRTFQPLPLKRKEE